MDKRKYILETRFDSLVVLLSKDLLCTTTSISLLSLQQLCTKLSRQLTDHLENQLDPSPEVLVVQQLWLDMSQEQLLLPCRIQLDHPVIVHRRYINAVSDLQHVLQIQGIAERPL